jgi:hypothetical protein
MSRKTTPTHVLLSQIVLSSATTSFTFSNIPAIYGDLVLVMSGRTNTLYTTGLRFNNDSSNIYQYNEMNSSDGGSTSTLTFALVARPHTTNSTSVTHIFDYASSDKHKLVLSRGGAPNDLVRASVSRWANTAAITSLFISTLNIDANAFQSGMVVSLYGVHA